MSTGNISIRFWHTTEDLSFISSILGLESKRNWVAGAQRKTLAGDPLPGLYTNSYWYTDFSFNSKEGFGSQFLFATDILVKAKETVKDIKESGGKIEIYLQLSGDINNGDTIDSSILSKLGEMGVDLLIEVFP